ncbi:MAG: tail fiber domain-containing protein [Verrucomicrobiales bacterium]|nr:tail fiber domain-containing protein [Verrucomicrobiales bacterium]
MKQTLLTRSGKACQWVLTLTLAGLALAGPTRLRAAHPPSASATPTVPFLMNYQGTLQDGSGTPLATGDYELSFSIYSAASGGALLWGPQRLNGQSGTGLGPRVPVVSGRFNVVLGPVDTADRTLADVFNQSATFLEITVGSAAPISPRQRIMPNAYAFNSSLLNGFSWDSLFSNGNPETGALFVGQDPSVAISETGAATFPKMDVSGRIRLRQGGSGSAGLWLRQNAVASDRAFIGMSTDDEVGFWGTPLGAFGLTMNVNDGKVRAPRGFVPGTGPDAGVQFGLWSDSIFIIGQPLRNYTNRVFGEFRRAAFGFGGWYNLVVEAPAQLDVRAPASVFTGTVSATSYASTSDRRLKTDIERIPNPLDVLAQIDGVSFRFDQDSELAKQTGFSLPKGRQVGVLAQEVEKVLPDAVQKDAQGILSVNYNGLTGVLVEAIKQQQKELEALRSELKSLREKLQP